MQNNEKGLFFLSLIVSMMFFYSFTDLYAMKKSGLGGGKEETSSSSPSLPHSKLSNNNSLSANLVNYQVNDSNEEDPLVRQEQWARHHRVATRSIEVANPHTIPLDEFSKLHFNTLPHPEVYHLYLRDHEGATCRLVKDALSKTTKLVRLYDTTGGDAPNYVTIGQPSSMLPKEALINPRASKVKNKYPTLASSSYPTGVKTFYVTVNGKEIRLDRGHNIPHADTLVHEGLISTEDAENYVPQNLKYNSPIRRDLEKELRDQGLSYKEISIYHNNFMYDVTTAVKNQSYRIPIP